MQGLTNAIAMLGLCSCLATGWAAPALAQAGAPADQPTVSTNEGDIVVQARKRQETILQVPVVVTAISEEKLDRLQVTQVSDLPKLVPGLVLGNNLLSIGTLVAIRGVGTSSSDPGVDQSVSLNIDGMSLGNGLAFSSGMFDVQQVEVLKGPQALFYGKSSPGGVISLRTADPTDEAEIIARAGYEFEADEARGELIVSGPLSDTLKARVAGMYSAAKGYFRNTAVALPGTGAKTPTHGREARSRSYQLRGTVLWNPTDEFSARLKMNLVRDRAINAEVSQLANCPEGPGPVPPRNVDFIGSDNCKYDRNTAVVYMDPANFPGIINDGVPFLLTRQKYGTLELNYDLSPQLSLTSTTGYYNLRSRSLINSGHSGASGTTLAVENKFRRRDFTEELRLNSNFTGPLNFTLGGFYQDGQIFDRVLFRGNTAYTGVFPVINRDGSTTVDIKTKSLFGQARWKILPDLEFAGGARWTDETRTEEIFNYLTDVAVTVPKPRVHASNVAPEATLTYTPTDDLTLFASYKRAYKSGSFSVAVPSAGSDNSFGDEKVKGYEIGLKSRLLDRSMFVNLAFYDYRYTGLQVGAIEPSLGGVPVVRTINAGSARAYGVDFDASYRPRSIEGLSLNASVNWNHGRYLTLNNVPCYGGQTIAQGCTQFPDPRPTAIDPTPGPNNGKQLFTAQNLSGTPLIRAPEWQATFGFDYEMPVGSGLELVVSNNNQYSSKYIQFLAIGRPGNDNFQKAFVKSDLGLTLRTVDKQWEFAVIGKNITDKLTAGPCSATNFAASNQGGQVTGGAGGGPAGQSEKTCYSERGRSVWLRLTFRPGL
jgi:iron complex outermembrane receptor protein